MVIAQHKPAKFVVLFLQLVSEHIYDKIFWLKLTDIDFCNLFD